MLHSSKSSTRLIIEPPSHLRRNVSLWQKCWTCQLEAYRFGDHFWSLTLYDSYLWCQTRFQNKRQSMRQTNRQSSSVGTSSHQPFSMTGTVDPMADDLIPHSSSAYDASSGSLAESLYLTGSSQDVAARSHTSHSHSQHHHHSSHRHHRDQEVVDLRKWSRPLWPGEERHHHSALTYLSGHTWLHPLFLFLYLDLITLRRTGYLTLKSFVHSLIVTLILRYVFDRMYTFILFPAGTICLIVMYRKKTTYSNVLFLAWKQ